MSKNQSSSQTRKQMKSLIHQNHEIKKGMNFYRSKNDHQSEEIRNLIREIDYLRANFKKYGLHNYTLYDMFIY